jgi:CheY-like chemotaxis protein
MIRVLLIEDHPPDVYLMKHALEITGMTVEVTHIDDGQSAKAHLRNYAAGETPDIIFLDLNLPKVSGLELLRIIRMQHFLSAVPVAVLTSSSSPKDRNDAYRYGANLCITKPAGYVQFVNTVAGAARELLGNAA